MFYQKILPVITAHLFLTCIPAKETQICYNKYPASYNDRQNTTDYSQTRTD
ncbi:hypothetical protein SASC598J21_011890 [Snodgrassella alvi SCGC AB-598-J21]|uniref:Uncharacterized protein n=1 Tax=Snodgrassella alvi SCGC AB-598-J21 TaxID=1385367 RepID=A0A074V6H8_9NEIS|nr:hypothetical protein SASC598J21_011890 [Snodgrassella alvi SCGC AB-598-J21]